MAAVHPPQQHAAVFEDAGQLYRLIADTIPLMVWTAHADGQVDFVNQRVLEYTGLDSRALEGWGWKAIVHPDDWERCLAAWKRALKSGQPSEIEMRLRRADGEYRWHHDSGVPLRSAGGRVARWFGIATDIEALRQSEQRFQAFMDNLPACAWIRDAQFRYTYVNRVYVKTWGGREEALLGRDAAEVYSPEVAQYFRDTDDKVREQGAPIQFVDSVPSGRWLKVKFPLPDGKGGVGVAGVALDITERTRLEEKARQYAEDVRNLVNRLVQAQESERRRVADELHDLIGQNLTALGIDLQALKQRLQSGGDLIAGPRLDAMAALVETTIDAIRGVMTDLRPAALEEFGLVPALRWYASVFGKRTGMKVSTNVSGRELRLARDTELALFRIVQEALTNAAKHSGGTAVEIAIRYGEGLRLTVEDDGRGFAEPVGARSARRGGFGLPTMRERAEAHGGTLRVEFPERGARLVVDMPAKGHAD